MDLRSPFLSPTPIAPKMFSQPDPSTPFPSLQPTPPDNTNNNATDDLPLLSQLNLSSTNSRQTANDEMFIETSSDHGNHHTLKKIVASHDNHNDAIPLTKSISDDDGSFHTQHEHSSEGSSTPTKDSSKKPKRRSSDAYPFSQVHVKRHESNVETGFYEVKNFEEHLVYNLSSDHVKRHSRNNSLTSASGGVGGGLPEAHPEILGRREKKFRGRSISQPHLPALTIPEEKKKKSAYNEDPNEPIKTEKVSSSQIAKKQRRRSFLGNMFACSAEKK